MRRHFLPVLAVNVSHHGAASTDGARAAAPAPAGAIPLIPRRGHRRLRLIFVSATRRPSGYRADPAMATAIRTIGHEDRLSLIDHLDELRTRLIVCVIALAVSFGLCLWQNHRLLQIMNKPLVHQTQKQIAKGNGLNGQTALTQQALLAVTANAKALVKALEQPGTGLSPQTRAAIAPVLAGLTVSVAKIPRTPTGDKPVTLGVGEPFTTTLAVTLYFALVLALPVILFQLYGFVLPAFSPREKRIALPLMVAIPFLFVAGVLFGYFIVLPAAVRFFQNFNSSEFNVLVQANQYYKFAATILLAMGLVFQVPVGILAATRAGIVTPKQLRHNRRYAIVACAAVAAFLPGDAITLMLETVPLYLLYELSILLASFMERRDAARIARAAAQAPTADQPAAAPAGPVAAPQAPPQQPSVQDIIDHTDPELSD